MPLSGEYEPSAEKWARDQAEAYKASDGREAGLLEGKPIIVMTSVGASSGKLRKTPLMRIEHEGRYAVVASKGGHPKHPGWYYNLVRHPLVELQDGAVKKDYRVDLVEGRDREEWWERAVEVWPDFDEYVVGLDRVIPVFVLTPVDADAADGSQGADGGGDPA